MMLQHTGEQHGSPPGMAALQMMLPIGTPGVHTLIKDFKLDERKAIKRMIGFTQRPNVTAMKKLGDNYVIEFSTSAFELARSGLTEALHLDPERTSRNVEYIVDKEQNGLIVGEVIKIKSWSVINRRQIPLATNVMGQCGVMINLYRMAAKILMNGPDAVTFANKFIKPLMNLIESNKYILMEKMQGTKLSWRSTSKHLISRKSRKEPWCKQ